MTTLDHYIAAHEQLFAHYNDLVGRLSDDQMAVQSLCPEWDVRGVITHTIGVEAVLTGWVPSTEVPPPFEKMGAFEQEVAAFDRSAFAARIGETTAARLRDLEGSEAAVVDQDSITPAGLGTYGRFLQVRVFDLWVHARDIAIPLGEATDDTTPAASMALDEVDDSVGYIVGKKVGLRDGLGLTFRIRGGIDRDIHVLVEGRAKRVDDLADPVTEVTTDVRTFIMLAAGRIDPQQQIESGAITWSGDDKWGEAAARNLAYTR